MEYLNNLVTVEVKPKGVALMTLNNPPLNLLTLPLRDEMNDVLRKLARDDSFRVVVLTGSGEKTFCVGADIKEFPKVWDDVVGKKLQKENETINAIEFLSKPVICAMEGTICGGGFEMAMACDIRILSDKGRIAMPEINLGVFPGSGGLYRLPKLVGPYKAMEMMYLGEFVDATECQRIGLVNKIVPAGQTKSEALAIAERIALKPFEAIKLIKKGVRELGHKTTEESFIDNLRYSREIFTTPDCVEGVDAFINKRTPVFNQVN